MTTLLNDLCYSARMRPRRSSGFTAAAFAAVSVCLCGSPSQAQVAPTWVHRYAPEVRRRPAPEHSQLSLPADLRGGRFAARERNPERRAFRRGQGRSAGSLPTRQLRARGTDLLHPRRQRNSTLRRRESSGSKKRLHVSSSGVTHTISGSADQPCRVLVMGFRIPLGITLEPPPKLVVANMDDGEGTNR